MVEASSPRAQNEVETPADSGVVLSAPNVDIFKKNGLLSDSDSLLSKAQFVLIRHALSCANKASSEFEKKHAELKVNDREAYRSKRIKEFMQQRELLDTYLSDEGILEAKAQQSLINSFKINKVVLVSPHRRTIQTAVHMLDTHPQKAELTLLLTPLAKEVTNGSSDIPCTHWEL